MFKGLCKYFIWWNNHRRNFGSLFQRRLGRRSWWWIHKSKLCHRSQLTFKRLYSGLCKRNHWSLSWGNCWVV